MSYLLGTSIQDTENQGPRRGKREPLKNAQQGGPKRAALGTITNQVRVQPFRAVKGGDVCNGPVQDENAFSRQNAKVFGAQQQNRQPFTVFLDEQPNIQELKPAVKVPKSSLNASAELSENVTKLPILQPVQPLATKAAETASSPRLDCLEESLDSPMVLDISHEEVCEKQPHDREAIILTVPEYAEDIYAYLRTAELKNRPKPGYMKKQQDITSSMRSILVDWLVEVSEEYKLHRETLFLAVNYIDRFLSHMSVQRGKLQLVGAASMFLASKYEEIYPPDVGEFAYITDDTYTKKQVLRMEHLVLKVLTFDVAVPTTNWFCEDFLKHCDASDKLKSLTMFLAELTLIDGETHNRFLPSVTAAAALCLARFSLGMEPWPSSLGKKTGYEVGHFADCLSDLHKTYLSAENLPQQAVQEKYRSSKFQQVSNFQQYPPPHSLPLAS